MNGYKLIEHKLNIKELDLGILLTALLLSIFGVFTIFSAVHSGPQNDDNLWISQLIRLVFALMVMFVTLIVNYKIFYGFSYILYSIGFLVLVAILALPEQSGTRRWVMGGAIQPSEIARIILIITLAQYLNDRKESAKQIKVFIFAWIIVLAYFFLIFMQPSLGYALTLIPVTLAMLYVGGAEEFYLILVSIIFVFGACATVFILHKNWDFTSASALVKIILATAAYISISILIYYLISKTRIKNGTKWVKLVSFCIFIGIILAMGASIILKDYQKARLIAFVNPNSDPSGSGYHIIQSKIAIGSGGLFGQGYLKGTQNRLDFLPAQHTDFIFSVTAEEWGFLGSMVILALYFTIIMNGLKAAAKANDFFGTLLATGIVAMLTTQIVLNLGVTLGLMPVTGVPLPLMSYGGSSLFTTFLSIGILLNVSMKR